MSRHKINRKKGTLKEIPPEQLLPPKVPLHYKLYKLIKELGWSHADIAKKFRVTEDVVNSWFNLSDYPRSPIILTKICELMGDIPENCFPEFIGDQKVNIEFLPPKTFDHLIRNKLSYIGNPFEGVETRELKEAVSQVLALLTPREAKVIRLRFGIDVGGEHSLYYIADELHVEPERIRQIQLKAVKRLRHYSRAKLLRDHVPSIGEE